MDCAHDVWYRELFAPNVSASILEASDLAEYRNGQVYINAYAAQPDADRDAIPTLFDLLKEEKEASVRAVLGHFIFVYIHQIWNAMVVSGVFSSMRCWLRAGTHRLLFGLIKKAVYGRSRESQCRSGRHRLCQILTQSDRIT